MRPFFSLIVPTRKRPEKLARFLDSVARTAAHPERVEVVLVIDEDDVSTCPRSAHRVSALCYGRRPAPRVQRQEDNQLSSAPEGPALVAQGGSPVRHAVQVRYTIGAPGRTMGALNNAGFAASTGDWVMLLNDDVILRTPGWDAIALKCAAKFPDPFALLHVNDTLIRHHLCVFPLVSRAFYELCGEVCPAAYRRYRIDDHIEDVFNLLALLGERRSVYLPDVIFEHDNAVQHPEAGAVYESDPAILALDAPTFDALLPMRKELALRVLNAIDPNADLAAARTKLDAVTDSFAIRVEGRQRVVRVPWWAPLRERAALELAALKRVRTKSASALLRAIRKRLTPRAVTP